MSLLQIHDPGQDDLSDRLKGLIEETIPEATAEVRQAAPRHYEITVTAPAFAGQTKVRQHRLVYGAISELMQGADAPVHAVDRLETRVP